MSEVAEIRLLVYTPDYNHFLKKRCKIDQSEKHLTSNRSVRSPGAQNSSTNGSKLVVSKNP